MSKYSFELKKKVVLEFLNEGIGSTSLARKYGIKSERQVRQWIHNYKELGDEGLKRSRKNVKYSFEFKLHMVEYYLSNEISYEELAIENGIANYSMISRWVNEFRIAGPDALMPRKKGRKKNLDKSVRSNKAKPLEENTIDTRAEYVAELENKLLKLRIENAFLKELRRLRLEDEEKTRERRESSTVSENSLS